MQVKPPGIAYQCILNPSLLITPYQWCKILDGRYTGSGDTDRGGGGGGLVMITEHIQAWLAEATM